LFKDGDYSGVLPYWRNVIGAEDRIEHKYKKVDCTLRKVLQDPVRDTVRARCLAGFKTPNAIINLFAVGQLWLAGRGMKVGLQRHVHHLNNGRNRMTGNRLELSLQAVGKCFSESERPVPSVCPGVARE
jgi:hypothetical protein